MFYHSYVYILYETLERIFISDHHSLCNCYYYVNQTEIMVWYCQYAMMVRCIAFNVVAIFWDKILTNDRAKL